jgi:hypothetical protein
MGSRTDADDVGLNQEIGPVDWRAKEIDERAPREQGIVLDGEHDLSGGSIDQFVTNRI